MRTVSKIATVAALAGAFAVATSTGSQARWRHGGWGPGAGVAAGFAAGTVVGAGAAASGGYYGPAYYAPGPYAYAPGGYYRYSGETPAQARTGMSCATTGMPGHSVDYSNC